MKTDQERQKLQENLTDLDRRIERLKQLSRETVTDSSHEFWRTQIEVLEEQRRDFESLLRREHIGKSLDLLGR